MYILDMDEVKSSRYETNKKYYNSHKLKARRLSLLFAVKTRGRIPTLASVEKYSLEIGEIVQSRTFTANQGFNNMAAKKEGVGKFGLKDGFLTQTDFVYRPATTFAIQSASKSVKWALIWAGWPEKSVDQLYELSNR